MSPCQMTSGAGEREEPAPGNPARDEIPATLKPSITRRLHWPDHKISRSGSKLKVPLAEIEGLSRGGSIAEGMKKQSDHELERASLSSARRPHEDEDRVH